MRFPSIQSRCFLARNTWSVMSDRRLPQAGLLTNIWETERDLMQLLLAMCHMAWMTYVAKL